uniref:hypothetical protein n=1 Tax=Paractinoplanes polyasparticus TaxID=2856853 RepID=UPI001C84F845|nr:hypothetical protein [Actinoplanes polyasparticus]
MALVKLVLAPTHTPATATETTTDEEHDTHDSPATQPPATQGPVPIASRPDTGIDTDTLPVRLVPAARMLIVQHRQTSTEPITADELAVRLGTSPAVAGQLLTAIDNPARINGTVPALGGAR